MESGTNNQLSPEGQRNYEAFLSRIPGYFQNVDFMNAVSATTVNDGKTQIEHEKMKARGVALVRKWSEDTTVQDWFDSDDAE
jgi:hypothetical protein